MESSSSPNSEIWPTDSSEYEMRSRIGYGHFSEVWSALSRPNNLKVSIKIMELENVTSLEDVLREVQLMRLHYHANILNCYSSLLTGDKLWIITKLMDRGSCKRILKVSRESGLGEGLPEEVIGYIMGETLKGLEYLHNRSQIHRDIYSGNILVDSHGIVKLADFGALKAVIATERTQHNSTGSPYFSSPEMLENRDSIDDKTDVWSLGVTVLELARGTPPYSELDPDVVRKRIIDSEPPSLLTYSTDGQGLDDILGGYSKFFEDFYRKALQKNAKLRPSVAELLKHKFVRSRSKSVFMEWIAQIVPIDPGISTVTSTALTANALSRRDSSDVEDTNNNNNNLHSTGNSSHSRKSETSQSLLTLQLKQSTSPPLMLSLSAKNSPSFKGDFRSISHGDEQMNHLDSKSGTVPSSMVMDSNQSDILTSNSCELASSEQNSSGAQSRNQQQQHNNKDQFIPGTSWIFDSLSSERLADMIGHQSSDSILHEENFNNEADRENEAVLHHQDDGEQDVAEVSEDIVVASEEEVFDIL